MMFGMSKSARICPFQPDLCRIYRSITRLVEADYALGWFGDVIKESCQRNAIFSVAFCFTERFFCPSQNHIQRFVLAHDSHASRDIDLRES